MVMRNINGLLISYDEAVVSHFNMDHSDSSRGGFMLYMPTTIFTIVHCLCDFYKYTLTLREGIHYGCPLFYFN